MARTAGSVVVVRLDNIGDFILWLDGARAIRRAYPRPGHALTLVVSDTLQEFAVASGLFDDVIPVDRKRHFEDVSYRHKILRMIAVKHFETAINPTYSRNVWLDDLAIRASGATERMGHKGDVANANPLAKRIGDRWYTRMLAIEGHQKHELVRNWEFARHFDPQLRLRYPELEPTMVERPGWLPPDSSAYYVLFPGSAWPIKQWPVDHFAELARKIHDRTGWHAYICGGTAEFSTAQDLIQRTGTLPIENACGRTGLAELAGVIAGASLVVTNDSSAIHFARALRRPAVAIVGGGQFGRFLPYPELPQQGRRISHCAYQSMPCYHCNWCCIHDRAADDPAPCITAVSVDQVWASVEPLLAT